MELLESKEFQELSMETKKIITIHLDNKKLLHKVMEEEKDMCKAIRDLLRESKEEGRAVLVYNLIVTIAGILIT